MIKVFMGASQSAAISFSDSPELSDQLQAELLFLSQSRSLVDSWYFFSFSGMSLFIFFFIFGTFNILYSHHYLLRAREVELQQLSTLRTVTGDAEKVSKIRKALSKS